MNMNNMNIPPGNFIYSYRIIDFPGGLLIIYLFRIVDFPGGLLMIYSFRIVDFPGGLLISINFPGEYSYGI